MDSFDALDAFEALVIQWRSLARSKFKSADCEPTAFGKQLIEHGAQCYFNCAETLKAAIDKSKAPIGDEQSSHDSGTRCACGVFHGEVEI